MKNMGIEMMEKEKIDYDYLYRFFEKYKKIALVINLIISKSLWGGKYKEEELIDMMILGFITKYNDPYADYMVGNCSGNYEWGLHYETKYGILFRDARENGIYISEIIPGSEAARKGVKLGDQVCKVNGEEYSNVGELEYALYSKKESGRICLELYDGSKRGTYILTEIQTTTNGIISKRISENIFYMKVSEFSNGTYEIVQENYQKYNMYRGRYIIIDLCDNWC